MVFMMPFTTSGAARKAFKKLLNKLKNTKKAADSFSLKQTFNLIDVKNKACFSVQKPNNSAVKANINDLNEAFDVEFGSNRFS